MSNKVEIVRISAAQYDQHQAIERMKDENPNSTFRGIYPEAKNGYWIAMFEKDAISQYGDDNTSMVGTPDLPAPGETDVDPLTPQDEPEDRKEDPFGDLGNDLGGEGDETQDLKGMIKDLADAVSSLTDAVASMKEGSGGFDDPNEADAPGSETGWGGGDIHDEGADSVEEDGFGHDQDGIDPFPPDGLNDKKPLNLGRAAKTIKFVRDREPGMSIRQARADLQRFLADPGNKHLRNYRIASVKFDEQSDQYVSLLQPKSKKSR